MRPVYPLLAVPAVTSIVGTKIYQDQANQSAQAPFVVWMRQAVVPENNLSQRPPGDRLSLAVDVFARTEQERDNLLTAARDAIEAVGHVLTIQSLGQEPDTGWWRMTFDADIFHPRG